MENKKSGLPAQAGFIKLIVVIVIAFLLLRYFDITITEIIDWLKGLWNSIR